MKLLTAPTSNPKIAKSLKLNVLTAVLHLAPYDLSGYQVCPMATAGCAYACLNTAGRGGIIKKGETTNAIQKARIRKTKLFFEDRPVFFELLIKDIQAVIRKAAREGFEKVGIRLNGTSDIPFEIYKVEFEGVVYDNIMALFPEVQFYDYTKRFNRKNLPENYHLTFSLAEDNRSFAEKALDNGMNVAAVFRKELPKKFLKTKVINGDDHDFRPADGSGVIVGLIAKGKAKTDTSGFVQD
jgi:hypothetical protein